MDTNNRLISEQFSQGKFKDVYPFFEDTIEWNIIGDQLIIGKESVIEFCNKMLVEMESSVLTNANILEAGNQIVIEGKCRYFNAKGEESFVNYCDIYCFENNKIKTITSYCI